MVRIRLRNAPALIRLGAGVSYGSGAFYGQTANTLTASLRELQDIEALSALSNKDPEAFLAYWKTRQKTAKGAVKAQLEEYANRAQKNLKTQQEDSAAVASYARTNDHQKYLDYLISKLDKTTDPGQLASLTTQINTMRGRVFASSGAGTGIGGGIDAQTLTDDRQEFIDARSSIDATKGPLTKGQIDRLAAADKALSKDLHAIADDANVKLSVRKSAQTEISSRGLGDGAKVEGRTVANAKSASDADTLKTFKSDADFAVEMARASTPGARAKLLAERARQASLLVSGMFTPDGVRLAGEQVTKAESDAVNEAQAAIKGTGKLSPTDDKLLHDMFNQYELDVKTQQSSNRAAQNPAGPGPVPFTKWVELLKASKSETEFQKATGDTSPFDPADFASAKKASTDSILGYDAKNHTYTGSPELVDDANKAYDAIHTLYGIPGGPMAGYGEAGYTGKGDVLNVLNGNTALGAQTAQETQSMHQQQIKDEKAGAQAKFGAEKTPAGASPTETPAQTPGTQVTPAEGAVAPVEGSPEASAAAAASVPGGGGGKPQAQLAEQPTTNEGFSDFQSAATAADTYLSQYQIPDLPDVKVETGETDINKLFPFSSDTPSAYAAPQSSDGGRRIGTSNY